MQYKNIYIFLLGIGTFNWNYTNRSSPVKKQSYKLCPIKRKN